MALLSRQPWCAASALLVPLIGLASPAWLKLDGVPPAWGILWLLPWALVDGRFSGVLAGLGLGLLLDATVPGPVSQIPGLVLLGWWWGRIGRRGPPIQRSFNLGLLALLGSLFLNLTLMLQWGLRSWQAGMDASRLPIGSSAGLAGRAQSLHPAQLALPGWHLQDLAAAGVHILVAQTLLTALLAPMLCSLQVLLWRQLSSGGRA